VSRVSRRIGFTEANSELNAKTAYYVGLDAELQTDDSLTIDASGFDAEVSDLHQYVSTCQETKRHTAKAKRGPRALFRREVALDYRPVKMLRLLVAYAYLFARRLTKNEGEDPPCPNPGTSGDIRGDALASKMAEFFELSAHHRDHKLSTTTRSSGSANSYVYRLGRARSNSNRSLLSPFTLRVRTCSI